MTLLNSFSMPWLNKQRFGVLLLASALLSMTAVARESTSSEPDRVKGNARVVSKEAAVNGAKIQPLRSLAESAAQIRQRRRVLMLYFSDPGCTYCRRLETEVLLPMLRSGEYEHQVLMRQIHWRGTSLIIDFDDKLLRVNDLAARYDIQVSPTLVFVDANGREVAPRILGYRQDFFWHRLDRSIAKAALAIRTSN